MFKMYLLFKMHFEPFWLYIVFITFAAVNLMQTLYCAKKYCGLSISYYLKAVIYRCFKMLFIMFIISAVPFIVVPEGFIRLSLVLILSILSFCLCFYFIGLSKEEQHTFRDMFGKMILKYKK